MSIVLIPVVLCAAYLVMVSICVSERMTPQTNHFVRVAVVLIGGAGFWALCKAVVFGWGSSPEELLQGVVVVALAGVIYRVRFNTGGERIHSLRNAKVRQGR